MYFQNSSHVLNSITKVMLLNIKESSCNVSGALLSLVKISGEFADRLDTHITVKRTGSVNDIRRDFYKRSRPK